MSGPPTAVRGFLSPTYTCQWTLLVKSEASGLINCGHIPNPTHLAANGATYLLPSFTKQYPSHFQPLPVSTEDLWEAYIRLALVDAVLQQCQKKELLTLHQRSPKMRRSPEKETNRSYYFYNLFYCHSSRSPLSTVVLFSKLYLNPVRGRTAML